MSVFSAFDYPHWLMIAGTVLVVFGVIGFALAKIKTVGTDATEVDSPSIYRSTPNASDNRSEEQTT
jgi:hypothetical protein